VNVCVPVERIDGLDSVIFGHFGSAPAFVVADSGTGRVTALANRDREHAHGACDPLKSLTGQDVAAVVVASIGGPALARLTSSGIRVLRCPGGTVRDALALLAAGKLEELSGEGTCSGHDHGHGSSCSCGS
jgi:predicted Fe-Mo cluster-binding NifX family protein